MIKAAATLRTLGYLHKATIVSRLPIKPTIMMMMATTAAKVLNGFGNLNERIMNKDDELVMKLSEVKFIRNLSLIVN